MIHSELSPDSVKNIFSELCSDSEKFRNHFTVGSEIFLNQY